ncbi:GH22413 [Drosophila grimshawi]|uniref:GH22413 n=1 Tax=Drosophila grimshawi TaxID=7222 RepID=B4JZ37_DROGR|nr:GH22413 [Drosophila grimshawi]
MARERFRRRRVLRKVVVEAVRRGDLKDSRVLAKVLVGQYILRGLLDTGTSVSLLGVDFWRAFELAPAILDPDKVNTTENKVEEVLTVSMTHYREEEDEVEVETDSWELSKDERSELDTQSN